MTPLPDLRPLDTSVSAWEKVRQSHARLGPEGRVAAAFEAAELIREAVLSGLRMQHPSWDDLHLKQALLRRLYGPDLIARALAASVTRS